MSAAALHAAPGLQGLREVRLYGHLGRKFGRLHRLAVDTAAEAVQALCVLHKGFADALLQHPAYHVLLGRGQRRHAIGEAALPMRLGAADCVRIVPEIRGAKRQGLGQVIVGAALFVLGAMVAMTGNVGPGVFIGKMGVAMMIGGVVQLLSPQRTEENSSVEERSHFFSGAANVPAQGGPVPLIIGRCIVGSVVVSSALSTDDISPKPPVVPEPVQLPYDQGDSPGADGYGNSDSGDVASDSGGYGDGGNGGDGGDGGESA